jgi:hypothetical protein
MTPPISPAGSRTPSPRPRRLSNPSYASSPPEEIEEAYRQINDADTLIDVVMSQYDDKDPLINTGLGIRDKGINNVRLDGLASHARDEQRLRRTIPKESPVFSKAKVGQNAQVGRAARLSAEDLQRRDRQPQGLSDDLEPPLNVPRGWGTQGKVHRDWMTMMTRRHESAHASETDLQEHSPERWKETQVESINEPSDGLPLSQGDARVTADLDPEKPAESDVRPTKAAGGRQKEIVRGPTTEASPSEDETQDPPVVVYRTGRRDISNHHRRGDSQALLQRLARAESPGEPSTPKMLRFSENETPDKTPFVTGGWVDTPMAERPLQASVEDEHHDGEPHHMSKDDHPPQLEFESIEPNLTPKRVVTKPEQKSEFVKVPKSALEAFIQENPLSMGDDTISSLEEIINDVTPQKIDDLDVEKKPVKAEPMELPAPSDTDLPILNRLNDKIRHMISNTHETKAGLSSLENRISKIEFISSNQSHSETGSSKPCDKCGVHDDEFVYITIPIPRSLRSKRVFKRVQVSTVLAFGFVFLAWYLSECILCDYYCHPTFAEVCNGYCLMPDAPRFPFTIPIMLWRWSHLSHVFGPLFTVLVAFARLIAQFLGLWDGFVDSPEPFGNMGVRGQPPEYPTQAAPQMKVQPEHPDWDRLYRMEDDVVL